MIKFDTSRFGVLEVEEDRVIDFPSGLVGFPYINRLVSPSLIVEEYSIDLDNTVRQHLQLENDDDLAVLVIMRANGEDIVANFQGPLLINASTKKGVQVVLDKPNK
jgi:flagellar assembly factor FliW